MGQFSEMEWNSKWEWENLVMCGAKSIESPKKLQLADCLIIDDGETDAGSFNPSAVCGNSGGASGSDSGHVYSAKSSVSASADSSTKDGVQTPSFRLMPLEGFSGNLGEKMDSSRTFSHVDSSIGSGEQLIGLKLGKRTYFENSSGGGNVKNASFPVISTPSISVKKTKSAGHTLPVPRCVVEGCNFDLSTAKEYHRKHRVCESHAKYPKVVVGGFERRFCQQCSRFHSLDEFDERKRSCRKRLSDHNARRRKPKQETILFDSTRLSSTFYEGKQQQQMRILPNNASVINFKTPASGTWTSTCHTMFNITKECSLKSNVDEGTDTQMHMVGIKLPHIPNLQVNPTNGFSAPKHSPHEVLPGSEGSLISSHVDAASPEYSRALSLLSTNSWGEPESFPINHATIPEENGTYASATTGTQRTMSTIAEGVLLSSFSSGLWHQSTHHLRSQSSSSMPGTKSSSFQEMQLLKTPYEADLFSNVLN